jgi:hypothetical protein
MSEGSSPCRTLMMKNSTSDHAAEPAVPPLLLEKAEKGSHRSMWELLLQLRVLLPYLARLVPLLDRGLLKSPSESPELSKGIIEMRTGQRDLEVQTRNQALQLERIEQQMGRLRVVQENSIEESRKLFADLQSLRRWLVAMSVVIAALFLATAAMVAFLVIRP